MGATPVQSWLEAPRLPGHHYELLGSELLDPDWESLRKRVRESVRSLQPEQQTTDRARASRVTFLQQELARAETVFQSPDKARQYEREWIEKLLRDGPASITPANVSQWREQLRRVHRVHEIRIEEVVRTHLQRHADHSPEERSAQRSAVFSTTAAWVPPGNTPVATPLPANATRESAVTAVRARVVPEPPRKFARDSSRIRSIRLRRRLALAGVGIAIMLLLAAHIVVLSRKHTPVPSPTAASSPIPATTPDATAAPTESLSPANSPASPPSVLPNESPTDAPSGLVPPRGTTVVWKGKLVAIVGEMIDDQFIASALVLNDSETGTPTQFLGFFFERDACRDLLDYCTLQEIATGTSLGATPDAVTITGVVEPPPRVPVAVTSQVPCVRIQRIERIGEPASRVVVSGPRRAAATFRRPPDSYTLVDLVRCPRQDGEVVSFDAVFQGTVTADATIVLGLSQGLGGLEVQFPGASFRGLKSGDPVHVEAVADNTRFATRPQGLRRVFIGRRLRDSDGRVIAENSP